MFTRDGESQVAMILPSQPLLAKAGLLLLLFFVNVQIHEWKRCLRQQRKPHDPPAQRGANVTPILGDIQVPPDEDSIREYAANVARDPVLKLVTASRVSPTKTTSSTHQISNEWPLVLRSLTRIHKLPQLIGNCNKIPVQNPVSCSRSSGHVLANAQNTTNPSITPPAVLVATRFRSAAGYANRIATATNARSNANHAMKHTRSNTVLVVASA